MKLSAKKATAFTCYFWKSSILDIWLCYESTIGSTLESQNTIETDGSINLFFPISYEDPLLISLKISGNLCFSNDFREHRKKERNQQHELGNKRQIRKIVGLATWY